MDVNVLSDNGIQNDRMFIVDSRRRDQTVYLF